MLAQFLQSMYATRNASRKERGMYARQSLSLSVQPRPLRLRVRLFCPLLARVAFPETASLLLLGRRLRGPRPRDSAGVQGLRILDSPTRSPRWLCRSLARRRYEAFTTSAAAPTYESQTSHLSPRSPSILCPRHRGRRVCCTRCTLCLGRATRSEQASRSCLTSQFGAFRTTQTARGELFR